MNPEMVINRLMKEEMNNRRYVALKLTEAWATQPANKNAKTIYEIVDAYKRAYDSLESEG